MRLSSEDIKRVWIEEKSARELTDFPEEFYQDVARHVAELSREANRGEPLRQELIQEELWHVLQMVQEIYLLRVLKAMALVASGKLPSPLVERERYAFNEIKQTLEKLHAELVVPAMRGESGIAAPKEVTNIALIYLSEMPPIIGDDGKQYGPFKAGEVGFLPKRNAELLIKYGAARMIEVKTP